MALTANGPIPPFTTMAIPPTASRPNDASANIYSGGMIGINPATGYVSDVTGSVPNVIVAGFAYTPLQGYATLPIAGAATYEILYQEAYTDWNNGTGGDLVNEANIPCLVYAKDDVTAALTDGSGTRPIAGIATDVSNTTGAFVTVAQRLETNYLLQSLRAGTLFPALMPVRQVRGVQATNVASLASFAVAGDVSFVAGDRVLLCGQTTAAQNGIYIVGAVNAGNAPLTRAPDMYTGATVQNGCTVEVSEGTLWAGATFKAMCTGSAVVGTNDPKFYPKVIHRTVTLVAGAYTFGSADQFMLWSATTSTIVATRNTVGGTVTSTILYAAPASARAAGVSGTGAAEVIATVAAGTTNSADTSTVDVVVHNF